MWLIGMMGSGKTTVGEMAASRLGVRFYDTDRMVVEMTKMSIDAIWDGVGEAGFRELESRAVATLPDSGFIAAAGGGAVLDPGNQEHMRRGGQVVWLRCEPLALAKRMAGSDSRPLLKDEAPVPERLAVILGERAEVYSDLATDVVDTDDRSVADVVSHVVGMWEK